jgi:hypothetical protein
MMLLEKLTAAADVDVEGLLVDVPGVGDGGGAEEV